MKSRALLVLALAGCPKTDEPSPTDTGDTTDTDTTDTDTDTTDTDTTTTPDTGCATVTAGAFEATAIDVGTSSYIAAVASDLGGALPDYVNLQVYGSAFASGLNGESTGTFALGEGADANYQSCSRCLLVYEDAEKVYAARSYFATAGTLTVDPASTPVSGVLFATITDAALVEVTIDPSTFESTPVDGGECIDLPTATIDVGAVR